LILPDILPRSDKNLMFRAVKHVVTCFAFVFIALPEKGRGLLPAAIASDVPGTYFFNEPLHVPLTFRRCRPPEPFVYIGFCLLDRVHNNKDDGYDHDGENDIEPVKHVAVFSLLNC
jgi:hypothetical protein